MVNEEQEQAEQELESAADDFIGALRLARGMDEAAFTRLASAVIEFGNIWAEQDYLPKSAVNILVGLFAWIDSASYLYSAEEAQRIKRVAMDIESLIFQHVVPAPQTP